MKKNYSQCAFCGIPSEQKICCTKSGRNPLFCPTIHKKEIIDKSLKKFADPETREFARQASIQEAECYSGRDL